MKDLRFPDAQEQRFQAWKRSYTDSAVLQFCQYADIQELRFQTAKRSVWVVRTERGLFADCQKWHFRSVKRSVMSCAILQEGRFADTRNHVFKV